MPPRNTLKLAALFAFLFLTHLARAQEEKAITISCSAGYSIGYRNLSDWGFNLKPSLQYKFSKHWSVQPEIIFYFDENRSSPPSPLPGIYINYTLNNLKKYRLFPYVSFGVAGWIEPKHEGGVILINFRTGIMYYLIKKTKWGMALHFAITSSVDWLDAQLGLAFSMFD